ncbi:receptor-like protein 7 [Eucalyptus grandis]|uniref:receptor-like protein 7 n=1 Tax=Eucalyptus grandis TaxID=71139 RepID=UPI00192ECA10|nr:receptor-like protein 7 [Eucalyptus grandis]
MEFKRSFKINITALPCVYPKFESWSLDGHGDCCSWDGVECDEATSHVIGLDLSHGCLFGTLSSNTSLFRLLHLESLNLAWNDFNSSSIPYGFSNLSQLHYLNLSSSHLSGKVPSDISRLSRLVSLDLNSGWDLEASLGLYWLDILKMPNIDNFIQNLTMLKELDLSFINMSSPFPHVLANFSSLKSLKLGQCQLHGEFPVSIFQLPNLETLDISYNFYLSGFIPELHWGLLPTSMANLSQLAYLDLSLNKFHGQIPAFFANLTHLSYLDLNYNNFSGGNGHWFVNLAKLTNLNLADCHLSGPITYSFENLTQLVSLELDDNNLQGKIPNSLWELKDLEFLYLHGNNLSGTVDLHKLKKLIVLDLSFNNISFVSKAEINVTLPKLSSLHLDSCNLHEFPKFLGYPGILENIYLSNNKIGGSIPMWMWNGSRESLLAMDLSHNFLTGFGNNQINLPLPMLIFLDISSNQLKTELPSPPPLVAYYNISQNFLFGEIQSVCSGRSLIILDLFNNSLNGTIPPCVGNINYLSTLNLRKNKLVGMIPSAYPKGCVLEIIDLSENRLQGPVPRSLANCTKLEYLNLAHNQILDEFPLWLSELNELKVVILKFNKFHGPIEAYQSQFNFSYMHIMDLSYNSFSGELPSKLLQSFHAMEVITKQERLEYMKTLALRPSDNLSVGVVDYHMKLINKGTEMEYSKVPFALMQIDFSNNKFKGHIPDLIGDLKSLILLNLSSNVLTGSIPPSLANLTLLESLDLSRNKLSGEIPQKLAQLTFLSSFNVSDNQLSGPIPRGSQFNTFSIDSFAMNEGLCGSPLPKNCIEVGDNLPLPPSPHEKFGEESLFNSEWKFVLIGAGVGFLIGIVLGNFIIDEKSRWFLHYSERMSKGWKRLRRH